MDDNFTNIITNQILTNTNVLLIKQVSVNPIITLIGTNEIISLNAVYVDKGVNIIYGARLYNIPIQIINNINTSIKGFYTINYTSSYGGYMSYAERIIQVI